MTSCAELARATNEAGDIGVAAREIARILHPHFVSEEKFALSPFGLPPALAAGTIELDDEARDRHGAASENRSCRAMLEEHQAIVAALRTLIESARRGQRPRPWPGS